MRLSLILLSRIKLITFDATNTLLRFKNTVGHEYAKVASLYDVTVDTSTEKRLTNAFKQQFKTLKLEHPNFGVNTGLTTVDWWSHLVKLTFRNAGFTNISDTKLTRISSHLFKVFATAECWSLARGVLSSVRHFHLKHPSIKLGVISNTDDRLVSILYELGIGHYFDFILISAVVKCEKPDAEMFNLALKEAGIENGEQALHVGDSYNDDYLGAKKCGWNALLLVKDKRLFLQSNKSDYNIKNDEIIESLEEIIDHKILYNSNK
ncbi:rhythmically expressed gene 2 protein-like protein [Dinothrombium tinctorium]|uniref:Rhythmically expressed gene 2 protein-like protein n=1 Tax=Dinothrombium tinctorium TaxID=1965070 RepID=A0A443QGD2_9ACAR|nr:rhythmically expressed gene 2 protein-like protein [Dinothrombium tinctorium]